MMTDEMSYNLCVKHFRDANPALPPQPEADQTLAALLRSPATAPALHVPDGLRLDFGGLAEAVGEMAGVLRAADVTRGDRVVLVVPDGPVEHDSRATVALALGLERARRRPFRLEARGQANLENPLFIPPKTHYELQLRAAFLLPQR